MTRAKIYIHVGMHKTGTSTIQRFLCDSRAHLEEKGITCFVPAPEINAKVSETFDPQKCEARVRGAEARGMKKIIYSAEVISTFIPEYYRRMVSAFGGREIVFIAAFRHWASFLPSRWAQNCMRRDSQPLHKYVENIERYADSHIEARFDKIVSRILETNPLDLHILSYDNAIKEDGIISSFLRMVSPDATSLAPANEKDLLLNQRRDYHTTEIIRLLNGLNSDLHQHEPNELFRAILEGRRVKQFYDFSPLVAKMREHETSMYSQWVQIVDETKSVLHLSSDRPAFRDWEEKFVSVSKPFVKNILNGKIFPENIRLDSVFSRQEWEGIPSKLARDTHMFIASNT